MSISPRRFPYSPLADPKRLPAKPAPRTLVRAQSPPRQPFANDSIVELVASDEKTCFQVHRSRLFRAAIWFHSALTAGYGETIRQQIQLREDDVETVELFVRWLYNRNGMQLSKSRDERFMQLARLHVFADKLDIRLLKNDIVWELYDAQSKASFPPMTVVKFAFTHGPEHSIFRKILVDWYTWHKSSSKENDLGYKKEKKDEDSTLKLNLAEEAPCFAADLAISLLGRIHTGTVDPFLTGPEKYYEKLNTGTMTREEYHILKDACDTSCDVASGEKANL